jgi:two-component system, OmpR family, alkaline phosphatase synthesis response regulator PhoP
VSALISVVDDDPEVLKFLEFILGKAGYAVSTSATPGRFFDSVLKRRPALCLIDVQLPGMDGREIVRVLRSSPETRNIPLISMSAVALSPEDKVRGLNEGADEYFSKPLDVDLLLVRVANLLARTGGAQPPAEEIVSWGAIEVSLTEHRASLSGKTVPLTNLEMKLLLAFLRQPGRVLPRTLLLQSVWDTSVSASTRTVDKHVETLRRKLPPFGKKVETVIGVGYLFRP